MKLKSVSYPPPAEVDPITDQPIEVEGLLRRFHHPEAGAVVLFSGDVRCHNQGKEVEHLEYEAYSTLAGKMISDIVLEAKVRWELTQAICIHRTGNLNISDCAVVVITGSPHRKEAYEANQYIIDRVKHEAPIWKREHYKDGSAVWGSNCNCNDPDHYHNHS